MGEGTGDLTIPWRKEHRGAKKAVQVPELAPRPCGSH